jgi:hypothetical protein
MEQLADSAVLLLGPLAFGRIIRELKAGNAICSLWRSQRSNTEGEI